MMTRRTLLGALKCAFRDLRRELAICAWTFAIVAGWGVVGLVEICRVAIRKYWTSVQRPSPFASLAPEE